MCKLEGQGGSWGVGGGREVRAKRLNPALFRVGFVGKRLKIRNRCGGLIHLLIVLIHCYPLRVKILPEFTTFESKDLIQIV